MTFVQQDQAFAKKSERSFLSRSHRRGEEFGEISRGAPEVAVSFCLGCHGHFPHQMLQPRRNSSDKDRVEL